MYEGDFGFGRGVQLQRATTSTHNLIIKERFGVS